MSRTARKFAFFALSVGVLAIASLWFVRAAIESSGMEAWASVAVGQAVGAMGAIIVGYGWSISGPTRVAAASSPRRVQQFSDALRVRSIMLPIMTAVVFCVLVITPTIDLKTAFIGALPVLVLALSATFYFVGIGAPHALFLFETVPRAMSTILASVGMTFMGIGVELGLLIQLAGSFMAVILSAFYILRSDLLKVHLWSKTTMWRTWILVKRQGHGLLSVLLIYFYGGAPLLIITWLAPFALAQFSVIDKLAKQLYAGSSPVTSVLQGWVPAAGAQHVERRARIASVISWTVGCTCAMLVALIAGPAISWISAGTYEPSIATQCLLGLQVGLYITQNAMSYAVLAAQNRLKQVAVYLTFSSPIGIILTALLAPAFGVEGALVGVTTGMLINSACLTIGMISTRAPRAR